MSFEWFIAMKHLLKGRRLGFVSLIGGISVLGIAVGVMALIVVLAVMSGFDRELKSKIVGVQPHLRLEGIGGVSNPDDVIRSVRELNLGGIESIAPYVEGQAMIRSDRNAAGILVKGIDSGREPLELFRAHVVEGTVEFGNLNVSTNPKNEQWVGQAVIGDGLAQKLHAGVGSVVSIISPALEAETLKQLVKNAQNVPFVVSGIYHVGMNDFDYGLVLVSLEKGKALYQLGERVTGIGVRLSDVEQAERLKGALQARLGTDFIVRSWVDQNRTFFGALQVEKTVMTILLSLIVLVAAFNIVSTLIMTVMEKTKDIGILRSLGATRGAVGRIFLLQGFAVGVIGVAFGAGLGLWLANHLNPTADFLEKHFGISVFPSDIYYFDKIPAQINGPDVVVVVAVALLMSLAAGLYPAYYAAGLRPVEALRYE